MAEIFEAFPDKVTAADGSEILIKNPERGSLAKRLLHLIASEDSDGKRSNFEIANKIAWLPRIVETLENAQAKIRDPKSGNPVFVRSYQEGAIHSVVVSKDGVFLDSETFDHGLITQFAERYAGRRDSFIVEWEKASRGQQSTQTASTEVSNGDAPYTPAAENNVSHTLRNVKLNRRYAEGRFIGQREYDASAITQFPDRGGRRSTRENFWVEREREGLFQGEKVAAPSGEAVGSGSLIEPDSADPKSSSTRPSGELANTAGTLTEPDSMEPVTDDSIYPTPEEVKSAIEKI